MIHLRVFVIFLFLCGLSHTFLPTTVRLKTLLLQSLFEDAVYLLFSSWMQQSLLTASCISSIWHHGVCNRADIIGGTSPVLFPAPPQGGTPGTLCVWRHGQRQSDSGLCLPISFSLVLKWGALSIGNQKALFWPDNILKIILKWY